MFDSHPNDVSDGFYSDSIIFQSFLVAGIPIFASLIHVSPPKLLANAYDVLLNMAIEIVDLPKRFQG